MPHIDFTNDARYFGRLRSSTLGLSLPPPEASLETCDVVLNPMINTGLVTCTDCGSGDGLQVPLVPFVWSEDLTVGTADDLPAAGTGHTPIMGGGQIDYAFEYVGLNKSEIKIPETFGPFSQYNTGAFGDPPYSLAWLCSYPKVYAKFIDIQINRDTNGYTLTEIYHGLRTYDAVAALPSLPPNDDDYTYHRHEIRYEWSITFLTARVLISFALHTNPGITSSRFFAIGTYDDPRLSGPDSWLSPVGLEIENATIPKPDDVIRFWEYQITDCLTFQNAINSGAAMAFDAISSEGSLSATGDIDWPSTLHLSFGGV